MGWRIFHLAGLAFRCRSRLNSNVRPHETTSIAIVTLRDFLLSAGAEKESEAALLSPDGIKLVFDVVRNYGIALAVLLGALEFSRLADSVLWNQPPPGSVFVANALKAAFYALAAVLFLLNVLFSTYVFERTPFYRARASKFRWAIGSVLLSVGFSVVISGALVLARQHAA